MRSGIPTGGISWATGNTMELANRPAWRLGAVRDALPSRLQRILTMLLLWTSLRT